MDIGINNFAGGLSGKLKNGDIVSVIVMNNQQAIVPSELKYVRVITTTSSSGNDAGETNEEGESEQPSTVTLLVNEKQATILAKNESDGKLHLSLVYRCDNKNAAKFLKTQNKIFKK